ncbi:MAG: hypothetical protein V3T39_01510 [Gammaproteobacteria bacterium]
MALLCWKCGASLKDLPRPITRHSNCHKCYAELHCCVACRHYTTRYTKKCNHDLADPPLHKDTANFCDYFKPLDNAFKVREAKIAKSADTNLHALFGGEAQSEQTDEDNSREQLESLFRKPDADEQD